MSDTHRTGSGTTSTHQRTAQGERVQVATAPTRTSTDIQTQKVTTIPSSRTQGDVSVRMVPVPGRAEPADTK